MIGINYEFSIGWNNNRKHHTQRASALKLNYVNSGQEMRELSKYSREKLSFLKKC